MEIRCERITKEEIEKYHKYYEEENMNLFHSPYKDITAFTLYYVAYIGDEIAGFTSMDFFKNKDVYVHGAFTFAKFRGMGVNRELWKFKMKDIEDQPNCTIYAINPSWLPDAWFQKEMLERKGFVHTDNRPDGAPVLTCKVKDLKK